MCTVSLQFYFLTSGNVCSNFYQCFSWMILFFMFCQLESNDKQIWYNLISFLCRQVVHLNLHFKFHMILSDKTMFLVQPAAFRAPTIQLTLMTILVRKLARKSWTMNSFVSFSLAQGLICIGQLTSAAKIWF